MEFALCFEFGSLEEAFAKLDYNGNGTLCGHEWEQAVTVLPTQPPAHNNGARRKKREKVCEAPSGRNGACNKGFSLVIRKPFLVPG